MGPNPSVDLSRRRPFDGADPLRALVRTPRSDTIGFAFPGTDAWVTYLKFDLSSIPSSETITGATLSLFQINGGGFTPIGTNLFRITNDDWSEGAVTWKTQPSGFTAAGPILGTLLGTSADGFDHRGASTWDLFQKSAWDVSADQTDGVVTLQLFETMGGT
jgi:hypothetical protein